MLSINTSTTVLPTNTTVVILVQPNGSATCRSTVSLTCCNYTYICPIINALLNHAADYLSFAVGLDFILHQTELTFAEGTSSGDVIFVDILDDLLVEGTESFTLTGSVAPPALFVGGPVTVSIIDNDGKCVASSSCTL